MFRVGGAFVEAWRLGSYLAADNMQDTSVLKRREDISLSNLLKGAETGRVVLASVLLYNT